jgi:chemotaxis methyl-accepting protein methylase
LEHIRFEGKPVSRARPPQSGSAGGHGPAAGWEPSDAFIGFVLQLAGLPAGAYRAAPMRRRLAACLRALKVDSVSTAHDRLKQQPELAATAVSALLIGVTEFFRDANVFAALCRIVLDDLAIRQGPIRIWSAACSNGAELYSLAIMLAESGLLERSILLGTDCRVDAIRQAQAGLYSQTCTQLPGVSLRQMYLEKTGGQWRVVEPLRRHIQWRVSNVLSGAEEGPWDIILWRNVAIYLEPAAVEAAWVDLVGALGPEGLLVVGKAEGPPASLRLARVSRSIYRLLP